MTKLNPEGHFLEKPSSLWLTIFAAVVSFAVALAVLQSGREVNASDIKDFSGIHYPVWIELHLDLPHQFDRSGMLKEKMRLVADPDSMLPGDCPTQCNGSLYNEVVDLHGGFPLNRILLVRNHEGV